MHALPKTPPSTRNPVSVPAYVTPLRRPGRLIESPLRPSPRRVPSGSSPFARQFGDIHGIEVGTCFQNREELRLAGIHGPLVAGVDGSATLGASSVVINGVYEETVDKGDRIELSGTGKGYSREYNLDHKEVRGYVPIHRGEQVGDQEWVRGNEWLRMSYDNGRSIRVIRGAECDTKWSPMKGYRYDGLYKITEVTAKRNGSGYKICMFKLLRVSGQVPIPERGLGGTKWWPNPYQANGRSERERSRSPVRRESPSSYLMLETRKAASRHPFAGRSHIRRDGRSPGILIHPPDYPEPRLYRPLVPQVTHHAQAQLLQPAFKLEPFDPRSQPSSSRRRY